MNESGKTICLHVIVVLLVSSTYFRYIYIDITILSKTRDYTLQKQPHKYEYCRLISF